MLRKELADVTYLESHVGFLSGCNIFSSLGNFNDRDIVIVASEELLCS
jgi:hypothetical protein